MRCTAKFQPGRDVAAPFSSPYAERRYHGPLGLSPYLQTSSRYGQFLTILIEDLARNFGCSFSSSISESRFHDSRNSISTGIEATTLSPLDDSVVSIPYSLSQSGSPYSSNVYRAPSILGWTLYAILCLSASSTFEKLSMSPVGKDVGWLE